MSLVITSWSNMPHPTIHIQHSLHFYINTSHGRCSAVGAASLERLYVPGSRHRHQRLRHFYRKYNNARSQEDNRLTAEQEHVHYIAYGNMKTISPNIVVQTFTFAYLWYDLQCTPIPAPTATSTIHNINHVTSLWYRTTCQLTFNTK